jgi:hypothetical protein
VTRVGERSAWARASLGEPLASNRAARRRLLKRVAEPLNQWRARSAVDPPRPIPNRVVKHRSAEGTGGMPAGRVGPCAHLARRGAVAARRAHNPKVGGSNPPAATTSIPGYEILRSHILVFFVGASGAFPASDTAQRLVFTWPMLQLIPVIPSCSKRLDAQTLTTAANPRRHTQAWRRPSFSAA